MDWRANLVRRARGWPLWGTLVIVLLNGLVWERGWDLLPDHIMARVAVLMALAVLGAFVTPEMSKYTAPAFTLTGGLLLPDSGPAPIAFCWRSRSSISSQRRPF